jgi:hypothetical protein
MQVAAWLADHGFGKAPITMDGGAAQPVQILVQSMFEDAERAAEGFRSEVLRFSQSVR